MAKNGLKNTFSLIIFSVWNPLDSLVPESRFKRVPHLRFKRGPNIYTFQDKVTFLLSSVIQIAPTANAPGYL